jgi:predicted helicase
LRGLPVVKESGLLNTRKDSVPPQGDGLVLLNLTSENLQGVKTNSDPYVYSFGSPQLKARAEEMVDNFNSELDRWKRSGEPEDLDKFLRVDERTLKWIRNTKRTLARGKHLSFVDNKVRTGLYRPFTRLAYYFERAFNEDTYRWRSLLPEEESESENMAICCTIEPQIEFSAIATKNIPCLHVGGRQGQCFPFYVYDEDGTSRRENVSDWTLQHFRERYKDKKITKWDIFYYIYGILHQPVYREKFADNLKRELARIPLAPDFKVFAKSGKKLAELHIGYGIWFFTAGAAV